MLTRRPVVLLAPALLPLALLLYLLLAGWHTYDADHWFVPWLQQMSSEGAWHALGHPMQVETGGAAGFANYNPPYLYLLALASSLAPVLGALGAVKLVAVCGTLFCAASAAVLLRRLVPPAQARLAAAGLPLLPTVALNGAAWGQTDAIYTGFLLLTLALLLDERPAWAMAAFGAAVSFKLPAVFLGPLLLGAAAAGRVPPRAVLAAPLTYALLLIPALLAGQTAAALAGVYADQAATYHWLSMRAPNPWSVVQYLALATYGHGVAAGMAGAAACGLALAWRACRHRAAPRDVLLLAVASVTLMPFLLPKMHDRYFFPADVLSYAFAAAAPGRLPLATAALVQLGSLAAYSAILFGVRAGPILGAACMAAAVALLAAQLVAPGRRPAWLVRDKWGQAV